MAIEYFFKQRMKLGNIFLISSLLISLMAYLFGLSSLYYFTFVFILLSIITMYLGMIDDLHDYTGSRYASIIIVFFLITLYFSLRLVFLDFSLSVGDASSYLWSGVGSVTKNIDIGFFLPLSSAVAGIGYQMFGLELTPLMTTVIYSSILPLLYFLLKEMKLNLYLILLFIVFFISLPLSIWFSKSTFSEPIWQVLLLMLLFQSHQILKVEVPDWLDIISLFILILLALFSRGSSIFLFGFITILSLYHFWIFQNKRILFVFVNLLIFFDLMFFCVLQIRSDYLIGWQFSRVVSDITPVYLILLLLGVTFLLMLILNVINRYQELYKKFNFPLVITLSSIILKIVTAFYFSLKSSKFSFFDKFFGVEIGFSIANFGYLFAVLILIGFLGMYYKAAKGNKLFLLVIVFYTLFFIPFCMMGISYGKSHELLLYWNRYYFSEMFVIHLLALLFTLNLIYKIIQYFVINNKFSSVIFIFLVSIMISFSFNSKMFALVTKNGYLSNSSDFFEWVKDRTKNYKVFVFYDSNIRYSAYSIKQLTETGFSMLGINVIDYKKISSVSSSLKNLLKKSESDDILLLCLSQKPCDFENKSIILMDKNYTSLNWLQHRPGLKKHRTEQMGIEGYLYKIKPSFAANKKYNVNKISSIIPKLLADGWHHIESDMVWSKSDATLLIPTFNRCKKENCSLSIVFNVFGASKLDTKFISFKIGESQIVKVKVDHNKVLSKTFKIIYDKASLNSNEIPLSIYVADAVSPKEIGVSNDNRKLGISLRSVMLEIQ